MLIAGVDSRKKRVDRGLKFRRYCTKCHRDEEFQEYRIRKYFTVFFLPVMPVDKGESVMMCTGCGRICDMPDTPLPVIDIPCIYCQKLISVTVTGRRTVIECPHCGSTFELG